MEPSKGLDQDCCPFINAVSFYGAERRLGCHALAAMMLAEALHGDMFGKLFQAFPLCSEISLAPWGPLILGNPMLI